MRSIEYVNEAFLCTTGYEREEVIGQNPRILQSGKTPVETYGALWGALTQGHDVEGGVPATGARTAASTWNSPSSLPSANRTDASATTWR